MLRRALTALAALPAGVQAQQWTAIVLHPAGARYSYVRSIAAGQQAGYCDLVAAGNSQAGYWRGTAATWTPLSDPSTNAVASGTDGTFQVGYYGAHAALWSGSASSWIDLHPSSPPGAFGSVATAVRGGMQVGGVSLPGDVSRGGYWRATADSFVDLTPAGANGSGVSSTDGVFQGGAVKWTTTFRAAIWNGTSESVIDLGPPGTLSWVRGMAPGVQVGDFTPGYAALWRGTPGSFVNMNPPGTTGGSTLTSTTGRVHAGSFIQGTLSRAGVNFGTPNAWLGLHQFLPPQYGSFSQALAISQVGPTIYVGGSAENSSTGYDEAILWIGQDPCYPNCDGSTSAPSLNVLDFSCFLNKFAAGDPYANCDGSTTPPTLNILDFGCFLNRFASGCS